MQHRSRSDSGNQALLSTKSEKGLLSESEQSTMTEKVNALSKEADDLRTKIKELETKYDTTKMTAKQHDKLVKQYLFKLFEINRELLPLKERIQKDAEERERLRIRQKLEAMGVKVKTVSRRRAHKAKAKAKRATAAKKRSKAKHVKR